MPIAVNTVSSNSRKKQKKPKPAPGDFYDVDQLADSLSVSVSTVYGWLRGRKIPCIRIGGVIRFDVEEVKNALKADYTIDSSTRGSGKSTHKPRSGRPRKPPLEAGKVLIKYREMVLKGVILRFILGS